VTHDERRHAILAIDTATTRVVIATGSQEGVADGVSTWVVGYRHGETLLPSIERLLGEQDIPRERLSGIVVGTGPGAFTGLRVGIATAKGLAHGLDIPLVGVSTAEALIAAVDEAVPSAGHTVLLLPAGPSARMVVRAGTRPVPLPAGTEPDLGPGERLVAVDLDGRAPADAVALGEAARDGLGPALLRAGAPRLAELARDASARADELAALVPDYVTLPRGVQASGESVEWSRDPR
jgi:tRNA threonylcarbamoyl adenosine modification protein YeaZ